MRGRRLEVLVSVGAEDRRRRYDFRPPLAPKQKAKTHNPWVEAMRAKLASDEDRAKYRLRQDRVRCVYLIREAEGELPARDTSCPSLGGATKGSGA